MSTDCELGICEYECCKPSSLSQSELEYGMSIVKPEPHSAAYAREGDHDYEPPAAKTPIGTIDLTPSWVSVVRMYLEVLMDSGAGTHAKEAAHSEILRAAKLADLYVKEHKG